MREKKMNKEGEMERKGPSLRSKEGEMERKGPSLRSKKEKWNGKDRPSVPPPVPLYTCQDGDFQV